MCGKDVVKLPKLWLPVHKKEGARCFVNVEGFCLLSGLKLLRKICPGLKSWYTIGYVTYNATNVEKYSTHNLTILAGI